MLASARFPNAAPVLDFRTFIGVTKEMVHDMQYLYSKGAFQATANTFHSTCLTSDCWNVERQG